MCNMFLFKSPISYFYEFINYSNAYFDLLAYSINVAISSFFISRRFFNLNISSNCIHASLLYAYETLRISVSLYKSSFYFKLFNSYW